MGVGAGLSMYVVVVQKFTFAISSPDEFLFCRGASNYRIDLSRYGGPKFAILWGRMEEVLLLNKFFSDCRYVP